MSIFSSSIRNANPSISEEESGFLCIPVVLKIALGIVIFLELLAPFVSTSYGLDGRLHLNWIAQFTKLIDDGILFPRWVPDGFYGFGAASFYFYPPLTFYVAALLHVLSGVTAPTVLFQAINFLATIASFFSARALLRALGSPRTQSTIGALLYTFAPFRIVELYHRGALPTHLAYVFIPLVWLGLIATIRRQGMTRTKRIILLSVTSALLGLTSVPVTLVTTLCIAIAIILLWKRMKWNTILDLTAALSIAIFLVAFHFTSVLSAESFAHLDETFVFHPRLVLSTMLEGINWLYLYHLFFIYVPVAFIAVAFWKNRRSSNRQTLCENTVAKVGLGLVLIVVFLDIPPLSRMLWNNLIPLQLIQFDFRFYSHLLLFVCVFVGIARSPVMKRAAVACVAILVLGAILPAILVAFDLHLYPHFSELPEDSPEYRPIYAVSLDRFAQTMKQHAEDSMVMAALKSGEGIKRKSKTPTSEEFVVNLSEPRTVVFHRFYWPYWRLYYEDGHKIVSRPDSIGRAVAVLPTGHYTATWKLERTPLEVAGLWISGIAWSGVLIFSGIGLVRRRVRKRIPLSA